MNRSKAAIFSSLVAAFLSSFLLPAQPAAADTPAATPEQKPMPGLDLARQLNDAFAAVADNVSPSVVVIEITEKPSRGRRGGMRRQAMGEGSGIIVSKDGYILTNNHIVDNAEKIKVYLRDGTMFLATLKGTDPQTDIAVIKINPGTTKLNVAKLGDSNKLRVGEFVMAIGHPLELKYSVTVGHVSALGRQLPTDSYADMPDDQEYIQTDAVINPGNSGGPLVNLAGEVIGVNSMMEGYTDPITGFTQNRGIGLAIPMKEARIIMDRLISDGKVTRSLIGIKMGQQLADSLEMFTLTGVEITEVLSNSPAEKAGLKVKDKIVAVDGLPVRSGRDLRIEVSLTKPGQSVMLSIERGESKKPMQIRVATEAEPTVDDSLVSVSSGRAPAPLAQSTEQDYGFIAKALTTDIADRYGVEVTSGVIVTEVVQGSQADDRGIVPGDIITTINNKPITSLRDFNVAIKSVTPGKELWVDGKFKDGRKSKMLRAPSQ